MAFILHFRFDVGPILQQELYEVPKNCTADELGATLAVVGSRMVTYTLYLTYFTSLFSLYNLLEFWVSFCLFLAYGDSFSFIHLAESFMESDFCSKV